MTLPYCGEIKRPARRPHRRAPGRRSTNPRHVPAEVKRAVWARDGGQCTFVGENGKPTLDKKVLARYQSDELVRMLLNYRKVEKRLGMAQKLVEHGLAAVEARAVMQLGIKKLLFKHA